MEISLRLVLPRDELSIPVVRRVLARAMEVIGVDEECKGDVELALTEACTNVLEHAHGEFEYAVTCTIDDGMCVMRVLDAGGGFDPEGRAAAGHDDESGRGLMLMQALVDRVRFERRTERGTVVTLEKRLDFVDGAPARLLNPSS